MGKVENKAIFGRIMMLTYNHWNPILLAHINSWCLSFAMSSNFIPCRAAAGISISDSDSALLMHHCNQASYWHLWASCFGRTFTNPRNSSIAQDACAEYIITSNASLSQTINQFGNQMASLTNRIHITPAPVTKHMHKCKVETFSALTQIECNLR